ncbi:MAG: hypothetical protein E2P02_03850 [Acidobacteria bacterium]|nr:MAG: hypothetical protein E2P02_03850 [Acidobacteriota bacterium]
MSSAGLGSSLRDEVHLDHAVKEDLGAGHERRTTASYRSSAHQWLSEGKTIPGLIEWPQEKYKRMTFGEIVPKFEELAEKDQPFNPDYPIIHLYSLTAASRLPA